MAERTQNRIDQQIGNYQLKRLLGSGGFADVYLGQHIFLNTDAAIKILHTQIQDKDLISFQQEARTIAHLTHPNIIHVLDFGTFEEVPFLVMEYAPHGSLRDHHPKGSVIELETVIGYIKQIAAALQYAHNAKLVHCDVKPENMLVGRDNQVLLSDFGISIVTQNTQTQSTLESIQGTAAYMAPEQISGKPQPASDQYALAIIAYEWLCGERPFTGSFLELCNKHLTQQPPPLRSKKPDISPEVEYVIMTSLQKDPRQRFGSVHAFANALEQAFHATQQRLLSAEPDAPDIFSQINTSMLPTQPPAQAHQPEQQPQKNLLTRRRLLIAGAGIVVLAAAGAGIRYALEPRYATQGTTSYVYQHKETVQAVAWHGDNIASGGDDEQVQVWNAQTGILHTTFKHQNYVNGISWSSDGTSIASCDSDGLVYVWPVGSATTASASEIYRGGKNSTYLSAIVAVAWSPTENVIASGANDGSVQIWDATNGQQKKSFKGHVQVFSSGINALAWAPSGKLIASTGSDYQILIWDADTLQVVQKYVTQSTTFNSLSWSPDGTQLACACSNNTVVILSHTDSGKMNPILIVYTGHTDNVLSVSWSPDGNFIASGGADNTVQIWQPTQADQTAFIYKGHSQKINSISWSNDSHRVASGSDDETVRVWEALS